MFRKMINNKLPPAILAPAITFILGIFAQVWFDQWVAYKNLEAFTTGAILISLATICIILVQADKRFIHIDKKLTDIADRTGLLAEYIEDGPEGRSYIRSAEIVENAKTSLIFVGFWEPFEEYNANNTNVKSGETSVIEARRRFYTALLKQVQYHQKDELPFHRRIVQIPKEYLNKRLPFETDPVFFDYLINICRIQISNARSCILRQTVESINTHFALIDNRYVIIPILTKYKKQIQARHGALIFDDTHGELVRCLNSIYWLIEAGAQPLELSQVLNKE